MAVKPVTPSRYFAIHAERAPRIRRAPISDEASLVVRGDELDEQILRADAMRFRRRFDTWGRYGVSALLASDDAEVRTLCDTRLEWFETVVIYRRHDLESLGVAVVPTFRTPHVTLAHEDLESLVQALLTCENREVRNPHLDDTMTDRHDDLPELDLVVHLNGEDESGLPWAYLDEARDRELIREGAWLVVGEGKVRAVAQVVEIDGDIVRVRPLPGPVSKHRDLLQGRVA